jgi:hypothetical protein
LSKYQTILESSLFASLSQRSVLSHNHSLIHRKVFAELLQISPQLSHKQSAAFLIVSCMQLLSHRQGQGQGVGQGQGHGRGQGEQGQEVTELSFDSKKFAALCEAELIGCLEQRVVKAQAIVRRHIAFKTTEQLREERRAEAEHRRGLTRRSEYLIESQEEYRDSLTASRAPPLPSSPLPLVPKKDFDLSLALAIEITASPHHRQTSATSGARSVPHSPRRPQKPSSGGNFRAKGESLPSSLLSLALALTER